MQMFGVGIMELMVILGLAVLVIGPDRLPGFAADLAKWIRQARTYANHMMKDFNEVVAEVQKEAGTTSEDWKEIASVFNRHTGDVLKEVTRATTVAQAGMPTESTLNGNGVKPIELPTNGSVVPPPAISMSAPNGAATSNGTNGASSAVSGFGSTPPYPYEQPPAIVTETQAPGLGEPGSAPAEELAWYVPERRHRRRALD